MGREVKSRTEAIIRK